MPDARLAALLARILPARVRDELFEPALCDLRITHLSAGSGPVRRVAALLRLWLTCCWMSPAEMLRGRPAYPSAPPARAGERVLMTLHTVRHALRLLLRERAFTATAVATLALGLGANLAIFTVIEAVMLRPLPYDAADELVIVNHRDQRTGISKEFIAIGDFVDLQAQQDVFETLAAYGFGNGTITLDGAPQRVSVLNAGAGLLTTLRVRPAAGRLLEEADTRPGAAPVAMISASLWETAFGSDPGVIGRSVTVGTIQRQIVGITPRGFRFPASAATEVIVPIAVPASAPANRKGGWLFGLGRVKPGVTPQQVETRLAALSARMEQAHPESNAGSLYYAMPLRDQWLGDTKRPLVLMLVAVAVVLLIACANVGNLLLARALTRRQEMAVRTALGAGRARLVGQLMAESFALTLLAGAVGLLVAYLGVPALVALVPSRVTIPGLTDAGIGPRVLAYGALIAVVAAVGFALLSAMTLGRGAGSASLASPTRIAGSRTVRRATSALIVAEVALSVVLLIGAGLVLRTFATLVSVDPGFTVDGVALVEAGLPGRYREVASRQAFYDRAFASLRSLPGVTAAGAAAVVPLTGNNWTVPFERSDRPVPAGTRPPDVGWQSASGGYFQTMRIPLLSGRLFDQREATTATPSVIISRTIEQQFFPGESAVGRKIRAGGGDAEIVGVVGDIRRAGLAEAPRADLYFPFERVPPGGTTFFVRVDGDPAGILPAVQSVLKGLEPAMVFGELRTLPQVAGQAMATTRLAVWLLGLFAAVALALAAVGVYGVMSYVVRQRTREFGTRVALGASARDILWLVMKHGSAMTIAGAAIGLAAGLALSRSLRSILYGVSSYDPATVAAAMSVLVAATMIACYLPARRATRIDAARTLKADG